MSGEIALANEKTGKAVKPVKKAKETPFKKLRLQCLMTVEQCADFCGVHVRTVERWDNKGAPEVAMQCLRLYDKKHLHHEWKGWQFSQGKLIYGKEKLSFSPKLLRQVPYYADFYSHFMTVMQRYRLDGLPSHKCLDLLFSGEGYKALFTYQEN